MESLKCPNCGAPINVKLGKCEYCGAVFHRGWDEDRLNQLKQEKISDYNNQIANLQTQITQAELSMRNAYLQTCIIDSLQQRFYYTYRGTCI